MSKRWAGRDSNPRPFGYQPNALAKLSYWPVHKARSDGRVNTSRRYTSSHSDCVYLRKQWLRLQLEKLFALLKRCVL